MTPAWYASGYHSADLQIAAPSVDALENGDFLVVLGDFHGGDNPLAQGLFGWIVAEPTEPPAAWGEGRARRAGRPARPVRIRLRAGVDRLEFA